MATAPKSTLMNLLSQVDYQSDAIVSYQVQKGENGNITLFAFDQEQELSEHSAPVDALVQILDGEAEIRLSGKPFILHAGEAIIMPANIPHAVKAKLKFKMLLTMIKA